MLNIKIYQKCIIGSTVTVILPDWVVELQEEGFGINWAYLSSLIVGWNIASLVCPYTSVSCVTGDSHQKMNSVTTGGMTQIYFFKVFFLFLTKKCVKSMTILC